MRPGTPRSHKRKCGRALVPVPVPVPTYTRAPVRPAARAALAKVTASARPRCLPPRRACGGLYARASTAARVPPRRGRGRGCAARRAAEGWGARSSEGGATQRRCAPCQESREPCGSGRGEGGKGGLLARARAGSALRVWARAKLVLLLSSAVRPCARISVVRSDGPAGLSVRGDAAAPHPPPPRPQDRKEGRGGGARRRVTGSVCAAGPADECRPLALGVRRRSASDVLFSGVQTSRRPGFMRGRSRGLPTGRGASSERYRRLLGPVVCEWCAWPRVRRHGRWRPQTALRMAFLILEGGERREFRPQREKESVSSAVSDCSQRANRRGVLQSKLRTWLRTVPAQTGTGAQPTARGAFQLQASSFWTRMLRGRNGPSTGADEVSLLEAMSSGSSRRGRLCACAPRGQAGPPGRSHAHSR